MTAFRASDYYLLERLGSMCRHTLNKIRIAHCRYVVSELTYIPYVYTLELCMRATTKWQNTNITNRWDVDDGRSPMDASGRMLHCSCVIARYQSLHFIGLVAGLQGSLRNELASSEDAFTPNVMPPSSVCRNKPLLATLPKSRWTLPTGACGQICRWRETWLARALLASNAVNFVTASAVVVPRCLSNSCCEA